MLTEKWVFAGRDHKLSGGRRAAMFFAMNNAALALRVPLLVVLTSGLGVNFLVSNVLSLVALTLDPVRRGRRVDLGQGAAARGRVLQLRHPRPRHRHLGGAAAGAAALPDAGGIRPGDDQGADRADPEAAEAKGAVAPTTATAGPPRTATAQNGHSQNGPSTGTRSNGQDAAAALGSPAWCR